MYNKNKWDNLSTKKQDNIKIALTIAGVLSLGTLIYMGFGSEYAKIKDCQAKVSKYVIAEFSETECGIDVNGDMYCDTDYWSEPASYVYSITTYVNGGYSENYESIPVTPKNGVMYPSMPEHDTSMRVDPDFDNFTFHTDTNLKVTTKLLASGEESVFNDAVSKFSLCQGKFNKIVEVKTWYGITYSSEF